MRYITDASRLMPDTNYIYVLGMDGKPQIPTKRQRHVKKLLDTGREAPA